MRNGIVIPCYNEADRLKFDAFQAFINTHPNYTLCFVNDGSKDATIDQLLDFQKGQEDRVLVLDQKENGGKAEAVRVGVLKILKETKITNVGFLDADLATGFEDYKRLVAARELKDLEMVFGSRKMEEGEDIDRSLFRKFASNLIGMLIKFIIGLPINDTQCGAKVFTRNLALKVFNKPFQSRWLFDVEIFIRVNNIYKKESMHKIEELGLLNWEEVEGSKITLKDSLKFPVKLFEIGYDYKLKPKIININMQIRQLALPVNPAA